MGACKSQSALGGGLCFASTETGECGFCDNDGWVDTPFTGEELVVLHQFFTREDPTKGRAKKDVG